MKKKLKILIPAIIFLLVGLMVYKIAAKIIENEKITEQIQTLPPFTFYTLNSDKIFTDADIEPGKAVLITYFHPECDFCHSQFKEISEQLDKLSPYQLVFVSHAVSDSIISLANNYQLINKNNIVFLEDKDLVFNQIFGKSGVPVTFIYNSQRKLVKQIKGQVNIKELLHYLNQ